jgi:tetratricopeptide (TPR) repeat protein
MDIALEKRKELFGIHSEELVSMCKKAGKLCINLSQKLVDKEKYAMAFEYLRRGEHVSKKNPDILVVIYNSMASLMIVQKNYRLAVKYFTYALKLVSKCNIDRTQIAEIHLNICACLNYIGKHRIALRHANMAIELLENGQFDTSDDLDSIKENAEEKEDEGCINGEKMGHKSKRELDTLVIAYYNAGAEREFLGEYDLSYQYYQKGVQIISHYFINSNHALTKTLDQSTKSVLKKLKE